MGPGTNIRFPNGRTTTIVPFGYGSENNLKTRREVVVAINAYDDAYVEKLRMDKELLERRVREQAQTISELQRRLNECQYELGIMRAETLEEPYTDEEGFDV